VITCNRSKALHQHNNEQLSREQSVIAYHVSRIISNPQLRSIARRVCWLMRAALLIIYAYNYVQLLIRGHDAQLSSDRCTGACRNRCVCGAASLCCFAMSFTSISDSPEIARNRSSFWNRYIGSSGQRDVVRLAFDLSWVCVYHSLLQNISCQAAYMHEADMHRCFARYAFFFTGCEHLSASCQDLCFRYDRLKGCCCIAGRLWC
jgi:hypothetical protein